MLLVNLTPHTLNIEDVDGQMQAVNPTAPPARVSIEYVPVGAPLFGAYNVVAGRPGPVVGLPAMETGTAYVVSLICAQAAWAQGRVDVFAPGELIRGQAGQPVGCHGLQANPSLLDDATTGVASEDVR